MLRKKYNHKKLMKAHSSGAWKLDLDLKMVGVEDFCLGALWELMKAYSSEAWKLD